MQIWSWRKIKFSSSFLKAIERKSIINSIEETAFDDWWYEVVEKFWIIWGEKEQDQHKLLWALVSKFQGGSVLEGEKVEMIHKSEL